MRGQGRGAICNPQRRRTDHTKLDHSRLAALPDRLYVGVSVGALGDSGTTALQRQQRGGLEADRSANLSECRIRAGLRAGEDSERENAAGAGDKDAAGAVMGDWYTEAVPLQGRIAFVDL
jgi:hypothetical protein